MIRFILEIEPEEDDFGRVQSLREALPEGIGSLLTEFYGTGSPELHGFEETATTIKSITIDGRRYDPTSHTLDDPVSETKPPCGCSLNAEGRGHWSACPESVSETSTGMPQAGDRVTIKAGPYAGYSGTVVRIHDAEPIPLDVEIDGVDLGAVLFLPDEVTAVAR